MLKLKFSPIVIVCVIVAVLTLTPYLVINRLNASRSRLGKTPANSAFLELWQIDTFEGGSASRAHFLEKAAAKYKSTNENLHIFVKTVSVEQAELMLSQGVRPDIISFGIGAGELVAPISTDITAKNVRTDLLGGGVFNERQLAVPWCFGGYVLCSTDTISIDEITSVEKQNIGVGQDYNAALLALNDNLRQHVIKTELSQYQAYVSFLEGDFEILLGTQRDFYRLNNRVENGKLSNIEYEFLSGYTDLVQYFSITTADENLISVAQNFVDYITSDTVQPNIDDIGLFPSANISVYQSGIYADYEHALSDKLNVLNVFTANEQIKVWQKGEI